MDAIKYSSDFGIIKGSLFRGRLTAQQSTAQEPNLADKRKRKREHTLLHLFYVVPKIMPKVVQHLKNH